MGRSKYTFFQRRHRDDQKAHERYSTWLLREIQIKTTVRYHVTLIRMAIIKRSSNNKCWRGWGERGTLLHCWWECKLVQPLWRTVWKGLKKLKTNLPYDPANPIAVQISRVYLNPKKYMYYYVHCSTIYNRQGMETA